MTMRYSHFSGTVGMREGSSFTAPINTSPRLPDPSFEGWHEGVGVPEPVQSLKTSRSPCSIPFNYERYKRKAGLSTSHFSPEKKISNYLASKREQDKTRSTQEFRMHGVLKYSRVTPSAHFCSWCQLPILCNLRPEPDFIFWNFMKRRVSKCRRQREYDLNSKFHK